MRAIDADILKEKLIKERDAIPLTKTERYSFGVEVPNRHGISMRGGINKAFKCLEQTPTIDAVVVVRCEKCEYYEEPYCMLCKVRIGASYHSRDMAYRKPDDFCSYGDRK